MGANDMPDGNSAALSKYMLLCDQAIKQGEAVDIHDNKQMRVLCDERLWKPIQDLMLLREQLSTISEDKLREIVKRDLDGLMVGLQEANDDL